MKKLLIAAILCFSAVSASAAGVEVSDTEPVRFDFGANAENGYISVSAKDKYTAQNGYGFSSESDVEDVTASGEGALGDAVKFNKTDIKSGAAFNVDLPEGMYKIKVYAGDIERMSIAAEGQFAIMNMTGNNAVSEVEIPVTDGQLNLLATAGKDGTNFTLSALEITKVPDSEPIKTRVFIGGDSITTTYYPLDAEIVPTTQGGWGQMLQAYLPDSYYVHNFATGGQFAKGFLESGQFEAIENLMQEGDYFIVGFGINDQNYSNEDEFKAAMTEMVQRTKAKGGIPVIITTEGRLFDFNIDGIFYKPDRWYKNTAKQIASDEGIHYIDLHDMSSAYFTAIGQEDTTPLYWIKWDGNQDTLHTSREGAGHMARLVAEELASQGIIEDVSAIPYGYSKDITLKFNVTKTEAGSKNYAIQNLKPSPQSVELLINSYDENGVLTGSKLETKELPAFDVLAADKTVDFTADGSARVFLVKDGKIVNVNENSDDRNYSVPNDTAKELYTDYVVPTPTPEPAPETKEK